MTTAEPQAAVDFLSHLNIVIFNQAFLRLSAPAGRLLVKICVICVICGLINIRVHSCSFVVDEGESRYRFFIVFAGVLSIMLFEKEPDVLRSGDAAEQGQFHGDGANRHALMTPRQDLSGVRF